MSTTSRVAPPIANRLELPLSADASLRVDFDRAHDRWRHRVSLVLPQHSEIVSPLLLLESVEGDSSEDWPVSPPLQFVSIESRPKKLPVALLIGMAGSSHWSASIEQSPADRSLRFDVACRAKTQAANLGSKYRFAPRVTVQTNDTSPDLISFSAGGHAFELRGEVASDAPQAMLQRIDQELHVQFGGAVSNEPLTYRWIYSLVCTTPA